MMSYIKNPKNFLVFHGGPGIGKTYFCAALVDWALHNFNSFRYYREEDLLKKLRSSIAEGHDYAAALEHMTDDDFVMLDDVGSGIDPKKAEKNYEWRCEVFFDFLDYRYREMKPTLITSNFTKQEFEDIYHARVTSRLFAKENTIIEINDGIDKRGLGL